MPEIPNQISTTALQKYIFDRNKARHVLSERQPLRDDVSERCEILRQMVGWLSVYHMELTDKELRSINGQIAELAWLAKNIARD